MDADLASKKHGEEQKQAAWGIPLGRSVNGARAAIGFGWAESSLATDPKLIVDATEGHCLTIAPTGAGKGRNVIIPTLLNYAGTAIVIDTKGENARVTAKHRMAMGQQVIIVDVFSALSDFFQCNSVFKPGSINPFDCLDAASPDFESDCFAAARLLMGSLMGIDPFWHCNGEDVLARIIAFVCRYLPAESRTLAGIIGFLCDTDMAYRMAVALDTQVPATDRFVAEGFAHFLGHERDKVQSSVRSTAMQRMTPFSGSQVDAATSSTSFDPQAFIDGAPMTIYLVIPPHKLDAYGTLLTFFVSFFLTLISRRTSVPELPTLFILDELAQLGSFSQLRPLVTLMRGYGVRTMMFLQDASQLRAMFPTDHATIINNCSTVLTFGHHSIGMAREMADLLGELDADTLFAMSRDTLAVRRAGHRAQLLKRIDYLSDPLCAGKFDANPMARARRDVALPIDQTTR